MRRLSLLVFCLTSCSAAAAPSVQAPATDAAECRAVDTSVAPTISSYVEGGVTIHTAAFPDRQGMYIVDLMAMMKYEKSGK